MSIFVMSELKYTENPCNETLHVLDEVNLNEAMGKYQD